VQFLELVLVDGTRRAQHQVLVALRLWKRDDVTDVLGAREHHHDAIDSRRNASMRRNAVFERIQQVTKPLPDCFRLMTKDFEHLFLQAALVNPDASPAQLIAVADDVVGMGANVIRPLVKERQVFFHR